MIPSVQKLKRKEGRRPAVLLGLRDNENDSGVIRVYSRRLKVSSPSLTIPVSSSITTEQVIKEALARFRLEDEEVAAYQLVKVTLEAGRGKIYIIGASVRMRPPTSFISLLFV